jgi:hypothetical protein
MRFLVAVASMLAVAAVLADGSPASGSATGTTCRAEVSRAVLPVWARSGFSDPKPRLPHVLGRSGRIVAIAFGYPLRSPPAPGRNNKILWVPRNSLDTRAALWIRAQRMEGAHRIGMPVIRVVAGGPGPSIINLPKAGCWRLTLAWSGRTDTLDLAYGTGR